MTTEPSSFSLPAPPQAAEAEDDMRLLFDEYEPKVTKTFDFSSDVQVRVVCAEQTQPGALQSGIFLWPAATALAKYLCEELDTEWSHVVELGAGCGLSGLVAARLLQVAGRPGSVLFTDRDWTSLKMIKQSVVDCGGFGDCVAIKRKTLLWTEHASGKGEAKFDLNVNLIIGSDLVYSTESARALIYTVSRKMMSNTTKWRFVLSSSFRDPETSRIIDDACQAVGLTRKVLHADYSGCLIENYEPSLSG